MEIPLKKEVYDIIAAAIEVHRTLGSGFQEAVYQEAFEIELSLRNISFKSQPLINISYKGTQLKKEYIPDLVIQEEIIAELKALDKLTTKEESQLINYLRATGHKVGLLINFGSQGRLDWKRMVG